MYIGGMKVTSSDDLVKGKMYRIGQSQWDIGQVPVPHTSVDIEDDYGTHESYNVHPESCFRRAGCLN